MSDDPRALSPEVEELVRDMAVDPRAKLLRISPLDIARGVRMSGGEVSVAQAGLTSAERHLVEAHRDEVAWLLREAFVQAFFADSNRAWRSERVGEAVSAEDWRRRAEVAIENGGGEPSGIELLVQLVGGRRDEVDLLALLEASHRLENAPGTQVLIAHECFERVDLESSIFSMRRLLARPQSNLIRSTALQAAGMAEVGRADFEAAWPYYAEAAALAEEFDAGEPGRWIARVSLLLCAACRGDISALDTLVPSLDERLGAGDDWTRSFAAGWQEKRSIGEIPIGDGALGRLSALNEHTSAGTKGLIDALLAR